MQNASAAQRIASAREVSPWISVAAAARILRRSTAQVGRYIECGLLRSRRIGPRGWRSVPHEDVTRLAKGLADAND